MELSFYTKVLRQRYTICCHVLFLPHMKSVLKTCYFAPVNVKVRPRWFAEYQTASVEFGTKDAVEAAGED